MKLTLLLFLFCYLPYYALAQTDFNRHLSAAALGLINQKVTYDPSYFTIGYPNGDVPAEKGVCTDVIIRTCRKPGIDIQKKVHEDMKRGIFSTP